MVGGTERALLLDTGAIEERTTVVGRDVDSARARWGFTDWPEEEVVELDLGGRLLEVVGIPGHHPTSVAVYDRQTGSLLTGDSVYPGRLYAPDPEEHAASLDRLVAFAGQRPVQRVLGCHIEMRRAGGDFPLGVRYQPDEAALPTRYGPPSRAVGDLWS